MARLRLLQCDRCGEQLYVAVNHVKVGDTCDRTLMPPEYDGPILLRSCPGTLQKPGKH